MAIYYRSSVKNSYCRWFRIRKSKCINEFNKIYLYAKDPYKGKYQYLINKCEQVGLDHFKEPTAFMEYSNNMEDVYKNIENQNPVKKRKY